MSQKRKLEDPNEALCQTPPKKSRTQYSLEDWKKSPSFLEVALYVKPHSLLSRTKRARKGLGIVQNIELKIKRVLSS